MAAVTLFGRAGNDVLTGGDGNDELWDQGSGNDTLLGGAGDDTLSTYGSTGGDSLDGGIGNDKLSGGIENDTLVGGDGNDSLSGYEGNDSLDGGNGSDTLIAGNGLDTLVGGNGDDKLYSRTTDMLDGSDDGANSMDGGSGDDALYGGNSNDELIGGYGNDYLSGSNGNNSLDGGGGLDTLFGGTGNDVLSGGDGNDELWDQNSGNDTLRGGAGDDTLSTYGSTGGDSLDGGTGNDKLSGGLENDTLAGGDGNDSLSGYEGYDSLDGGNGSDTLIAGNGRDTLVGGNGDDKLYSRTTDMLDGSDDGANSMDGGSGDDALYGGTLNDTLIGGDDNDYLSGGDGDDSLDGGNGNDSLYGGAGNDTLDVGGGTDLIRGGDGNDLYKISSRFFNIDDSGGTDAAVVSDSFVKLPSSIENVTYINRALELPYWIDALVADKGASFSTLLDASKTINYAFPTSLPSYDSSADHALGYRPFNAQQKAFSALALSYVSSVLGLQFVESAIAAAPNTIAFANNSQADSAGYAKYPSAEETGSDLYLSVNTAGNLAPMDGKYSALTLIHELGHALGLKHPFSHPDVDGIIGSSPYLPSAEDDTSFTIMSYTDNVDQYHLAFSPLDIAALQYLYGPSLTSRAGNDDYSVSADDSNLIWDGAGIDTLNASTISQSVTLFLEPGYWGFIGSKAATITAAGQVTVNFGSVIENLVGGSGSDGLFGNASDNTLSGGIGDDSLCGLAGNDTFDGGAGTDTAVYKLAKSEYKVTTMDGGYRVQANTGVEGRDNLFNIEQLQFADQTLDITAAVADTVSPVLATDFSAGESADIAIGRKIVLTFSEAIAKGIGSVVLKTASGFTVATFDAASSNLSISGSTLTVNPGNYLRFGTTYVVELGAGAVTDLADNGVAGTESYKFSTENFSAAAYGAMMTGQVYDWKTHTLLSNVDMKLTSQNLATSAATFLASKSGVEGTFGFEPLDAGSYKLDVSKALTTAETGSAINSADALAALKIAVGRNPNADPDGAGPLLAPAVSPYQFIAADANQDGKITSADALAILKMAVKRTDAPAKEWLFVNENQDFWNEVTSSFTTTKASVLWDKVLQVSSPLTTQQNVVAVLKGDVNGSWVAPIGSQDLDITNPAYFTDLAAKLGTQANQWAVIG